MDLASVLRDRVAQDPFNAVATAIFVLAICHTFATGSIAALAHRARPSSLKAVESGRSLPRKVTSEIRRSSRAVRKTKDIVKADLPEVLITGCRDTQTSADAFINGRYNGALTFALVDAMRKGKTGLTYKDLHDKAAVVLKARKFEQVPQLEGRTDRFDTPLFSA